MPVYVAAIPGLILVCLQLYRDATGWEQRHGGGSAGIEMDEVSDYSIAKPNCAAHWPISVGSSVARSALVAGTHVQPAASRLSLCASRGQGKMVHRDDHGRLHLRARLGGF